MYAMPVLLFIHPCRRAHMTVLPRWCPTTHKARSETRANILLITVCFICQSAGRKNRARTWGDAAVAVRSLFRHFLIVAASGEAARTKSMEVVSLFQLEHKLLSSATSHIPFATYTMVPPTARPPALISFLAAFERGFVEPFF